MLFGLQAHFYETEGSEKPLYKAEIYGIDCGVFSSDYYKKYPFVKIPSHFIDYELEVTKEELYNMTILYSRNNRKCSSASEKKMIAQNPRLMSILSKGKECRKIILWIYEYDIEAILYEDPLEF